MATVESDTKSGQAGATRIDKADVKGKIIEFLWWAEKQGLAPETIRGYRSCLKALVGGGAAYLILKASKKCLRRRKIGVLTGSET